MIDHVARLLALCEGSDSIMPPTELFNEGWLLRLTLDWYSQRPPSTSPLSFSAGARWYSEGLLASPFLARTRGDGLAEGYTHADGIIGHFAVSPGERSEIRLKREATQLVVIEAKMGSPLSSGTKNAPGYDQAARNVACTAYLVGRAGRHSVVPSKVGFYVVAPEDQVRAGVFETLVTKESILKKVQARVEQYGGAKDEWMETAFVPVLQHMSVEVITWEQIIGEAERTDFGEQFGKFYARCRRVVPRFSKTT